MANPRRTVATVQVELACDVDEADDLIHEVWGAGDPEDKLNAVVWVRDVREKTEDE